jgi:undecaprenyl-diphosphatase
MALLPLILLAIVQGITEFLPISSSGHLMILHAIINNTQDWQTRTIIDVSLHIGTLVAVVVYFRESVKKMLCAAWAVLQGRRDGNPAGRRLGLNILIASAPVLIVGYILHVMQPSWLMMIEVVAWMTLIFGIVLWVSDHVGGTEKKLDGMTRKEALWIGLAQALALIPGTSRAGITMTAARFLGYSRTESAEFSLLLALISITGAGTLSSIDLVKSGDFSLWYAAIIGGVIAMITAWLTIAAMMHWLSRASFAPFAIYRIILGSGLLILIYSGFWTG